MLVFSTLLFSLCSAGNELSAKENFNSELFLSKAESLSTSVNSFQLAKATFLPDTKDDLGFSGRDAASSGYGQGDVCKDYPLSQCPANGTCSSCVTNFNRKKLTGCKSGYKISGNACVPSTCATLNSGYAASMPSNSVCIKVSQYGLTCYSNCRNISCGSYPVNCPAEMTGDSYTANGITYQSCPDCPASTSSSSTTVYSCTTRKCKITSCPSTQKLNSAGTACINKDDTCPTNYYKSCETGTQGDPKYTELGTACYQCKPAEVKCEAPYYRNNENTCVLWDGVAAVVKSCSDLITTTKNGNITGNILVWGTIDCKENAITLSTGQNLVGKGYFNGKYSDATDSETNKFSKITWDFTSSAANALTLEHNATLADLTLEIKSDVAGKWVSPSYQTPILLEVGSKENLIFKNVDLYADMSAADGKSLTMIDATTGKIALQGKNAFRFKNVMKSNSDGNSYSANSSTYLVKNGTLNIGKDASLDITFTDGGSYYGFTDTNLNMTDNAKLTFKNNVSSYFKLFDSASSLNYTGNKITLRGTSNITVTADKNFGFSGGIPLYMYDNSVINFKGNYLMNFNRYNGTLTGDNINMNGNSIINAYGIGTSAPVGFVGMTLNDSATLRVKTDGIAAIDGSEAKLNDNAKLIVQQNTTTPQSDYTGVIDLYRNSPVMSGSSKFYIEANRHIFDGAGFNLASTTAKIYARQTNTSGKIFGVGYSNPEIWLYKTVANAPFYIETPGQNGYNGAEDDGMYLMPALGVSSSDGASICSHMTGGYSSSKINRDLACWTHDEDANPNNNDYLKGKQCDRCSTGYKLTGVTHVSKSDSRFTSTKSDFDKEMSALTSAMSF